ncbi:DUF3097 domain-containing protein [Corynebacterium ulcerans]|uniref:Protein of uncharacterized function (DUF3097) n=1 Tax=Corynebacterium ulcerans TaxID=65058 RepID=A0ABD7MS25_CORUL|nr:DUF3097 domain-containing protein [Corynebacterium ulcerans]SQG50576.1 Protein of uncharacterised function (DUF3097) [Corynebacterium ulcerans]
MSFTDPYSGNILNGHSRQKRPSFPQIPAEPGLVVEVMADGFVGAVVNFERTYDGDFIRLEDRHGRERIFKMREGAFMIDGQRVSLTRYVPKAPQQRSNSGSRRVHNVEAKVAALSRIWVEGIHDAAIVEKIWGHDLRVEGVVVEYLEGLDNLPERLDEFQPQHGRRVGVLADHLVTGSKEMRLTSSVGPHVLVTGHPFIDIWAAVKPERLGLRAWPGVPYGEDWKTGVCRRVGWSDPKEGWNRVYNAVSSFRDVDSSLIGAVERLVDFVTTPELSKEDLV